MAESLAGKSLDPSVQFSSVAQSCLTLCDPMDYSTPGFPVHHKLPELTQTHVYQGSDAIQPSHPLSPSSPALNLSQHHPIRWPKYWSFSISQGTLRSLLQHHSSKASVLWCSTFLMVQLSHPSMTTGKTIALTRRTFVASPRCIVDADPITLNLNRSYTEAMTSYD